MEHDNNQIPKHFIEAKTYRPVLYKCKDDSSLSLDESLPYPRPGVVDEFVSVSPTVGMIVGKNKIVECSSLENDSFHQVEPNELDPAFVRLELMLPIYNRWKNQFGEEDHGESDLIAFIKQLKDEEISIYFTDTILEKAKKWNDEHGYGIIDLIRYAIIDGLENKRQCPLTPFDTSRDKEWIEQVYDSVRDGELSYKRHLQVYTSDDPLHISPEKDLRNLMSIFKDQTLEEQIFFYHGTTEINAQLIISRGIHLHLNRSRPGDFGFGFYTTNSLFDALRHAENRANRTDGEQRAACLIFSISKHEFNSYQIVRLSYDEKHEVAGEKMDESTINNNNIFEWCNFVYKCLNNDPPLPLIHNKDAIIGPISMNLRNITLGHKPIKRRGRPIPTQTAIISMKLVFALLDGLKGVIISGKKK